MSLFYVDKCFLVPFYRTQILNFLLPLLPDLLIPSSLTVFCPEAHPKWITRHTNYSMVPFWKTLTTHQPRSSLLSHFLPCSSHSKVSNIFSTDLLFILNSSLTLIHYHPQTQATPVSSAYVYIHCHCCIEFFELHPLQKGQTQLPRPFPRPLFSWSCILCHHNRSPACVHILPLLVPSG